MSGTALQDATPPAGEWAEFFLASIKERDEEIAALRNEVNRRDGALIWLAENMPRALDLCPIKVKL